MIVQALCDSGSSRRPGIRVPGLGPRAAIVTRIGGRCTGPAGGAVRPAGKVVVVVVPAGHYVSILGWDSDPSGALLGLRFSAAVTTRMLCSIDRRQLITATTPAMTRM